MKRHTSLAAARQSDLRHPVVTLGVFDGVHVGHRYVIRECMRLATARDGESVVVTFAQHPRAIIQGQAPKLITSIAHRLQLFDELGVDHCLVLTFDEALRAMPAHDFARLVFQETLRAEVVVLGHNCRFGKDRQGGADFLIEHADFYPFEVRHAQALKIGADIVSSTRIREAILTGDLDRAASMLGRPFSVLGTVVAGDRRGRELGFPTANLDLHHELRPPQGVYGCKVRVGDLTHYALTNIGFRPTFKDVAALEGRSRFETRDKYETVETHLLDFDGDLYGQDAEVTFLIRLRGEMKFAGPGELAAQIARDVAEFRTWLDGRGTVGH